MIYAIYLIVILLRKIGVKSKAQAPITDVHIWRVSKKVKETRLDKRVPTKVNRKP